MEEKRYQSGDAVINEGGPGDFFYVTGSGELQVQQCSHVGSTRLYCTARSTINTVGTGFERQSW